MRFGFLHALARVIERNSPFRAGADIFEPGQNIKMVFAAELVIHAEIFVHHRFRFYDEKVESGEFFPHKIERVFGARNSLTDFFKKQTVVRAKRHGAALHGGTIKMVDPVQKRRDVAGSNHPDFGGNPHFAAQVFSRGPGKAGQEFLQVLKIDRHSGTRLTFRPVVGIEHFRGKSTVMAKVVKRHDVAFKFSRESLQGVKGHFERRLEGARINLRINPDFTRFPHQQPHP